MLSFRCRKNLASSKRDSAGKAGEVIRENRSGKAQPRNLQRQNLSARPYVSSRISLFEDRFPNELIWLSL